MCTSVVLKVVRAKPSQAAAAAAAFVAAEAVEEQRWRLASDRAAADRNERASRARLEAKKKRLALLKGFFDVLCKKTPPIIYTNWLRTTKPNLSRDRFYSCSKANRTASRKASSLCTASCARWRKPTRPPK